MNGVENTKTGAESSLNPPRCAEENPAGFLPASHFAFFDKGSAALCPSGARCISRECDLAKIRIRAYSHTQCVLNCPLHGPSPIPWGTASARRWFLAGAAGRPSGFPPSRLVPPVSRRPGRASKRCPQWHSLTSDIGRSVGCTSPLFVARDRRSRPGTALWAGGVWGAVAMRCQDSAI